MNFINWQKQLFDFRYGKRINILKEDWDTLIILDACRYDMFKDINTVSGNLSVINSINSATPAFLRDTFGKEDHPNINIVSANPMYEIESICENFNDFIKVWETKWHSRQKTVMPQAMVSDSIKMREKWPKKRLIIHFLQPHVPFIGHDTISFKVKENSFWNDGYHEWNYLRDNPDKKERFITEYRRNLLLAISHLKRILKNINGKTVVTSDHGNVFGKWYWPKHTKVWGHRNNIFLPGLLRVPWLVVK